MARAKTKTWLPLDRWAQIIGLDLLHFNQLHSEDLAQRLTCGSVWFQYAYQDAHRVGREDVARAISLAEVRISNVVGYDLLPTWHADEQVRTNRPARPDVFSTGYNVRGAAKSIRVSHGHVISAGERVKALIEAGVAIVRSDDDGDGYEETATITVAAPDNPCELHVYFPGVDGADIWEIKPIKISASGGVATVEFNSWQIVEPAAQEVYNPAPIDADDAGSYITTVDVYRVYSDPSEATLFLWENLPNECNCGSTDCEVCSLGSQYGCLHVRDPRLGIMAYRPGTWNESTETFDPAVFSVSRDPDRMIVSYISGWQAEGVSCPYSEMDPFWEYAVAYYAASLLDRNVCECENVQNFVASWKEDLLRAGADVTWQITPEMANNPLGTTRGALFAWKCCTDPGRRLITAASR